MQGKKRKNTGEVIASLKSGLSCCIFMSFSIFIVVFNSWRKEEGEEEWKKERRKERKKDEKEEVNIRKISFDFKSVLFCSFTSAHFSGWPVGSKKEVELQEETEKATVTYIFGLSFLINLFCFDGLSTFV